MAGGATRNGVVQRGHLNIVPGFGVVETRSGSLHFGQAIMRVAGAEWPPFALAGDAGTFGAAGGVRGVGGDGGGEARGRDATGGVDATGVDGFAICGDALGAGGAAAGVVPLSMDGLGGTGAEPGFGGYAGGGLPGINDSGKAFVHFGH